MPERRSFDAVIAGGGHNALVAATLLARAGRSVVVLERRDEVGGAAVSAAPFPGFDVRLSRYSYLVSLFPVALQQTLGVSVEMRRRRVAAYPLPDPDATFQTMLSNVANRIFPTLTEPLRSREEMRRLLDDDATWDSLFETPLSELIERTFASDLTRGTVLTDGLIGTFAPADDPLSPPEPLLPVPRRRRQLGRAGRRHGRAVGRARGSRAHGRCGTRDRRGGRLDRGRRPECRGRDGRRADLCRAPRARRRGAEHIADAPGRTSAVDPPEGAQLKINMLLRRLPRVAGCGRQLRGRVHRNLPRERGLRAARRRIQAGVRRRDPGHPAVRGVLPLADRPDHPVRRTARRRGPDVHAVRAAHAGEAVRRRRCQGACGRRHAPFAELSPRRADSRTACWPSRP